MDWNLKKLPSFSIFFKFARCVFKTSQKKKYIFWFPLPPKFYLISSSDIFFVSEERFKAMILAQTRISESVNIHCWYHCKGHSKISKFAKSGSNMGWYVLESSEDMIPQSREILQTLEHHTNVCKISWLSCGAISSLVSKTYHSKLSKIPNFRMPFTAVSMDICSLVHVKSWKKQKPW